MGQKQSHQEERSFRNSTAVASTGLHRSTHMPQISELAKILSKKNGGHGSSITAAVFAKHVFPPYQDLGIRLFIHLNKCLLSTEDPSLQSQQSSFLSMSAKEFCHAVEHIFITQINDELQLDMCLKMYGENGQMAPDGFRELLLISYTVAVDHYSGGPANCTHFSRTIEAVVNAAFHHKKTLSQSYLSQWILHNCPRLTVGLHRYIVHKLSTAYRLDESTTGLEASTPVLDEEPSFSDKFAILPLSEVWLLAVSLPELYTRPSTPPRSCSANGLTSQSLIAKMVGLICPSHWTSLYKSCEHGLGSNRFNHHVFNYRGPTVMMIRCENDMQFCIASSCEWKESHQYWGTHDCALFQILPEFHCLAVGREKLLYFNETIRGYPKGIRVGADPLHPIVEINADFTHLSFLAAPYSLLELQVWGCGTEQHRQAQLDIKQTYIKDAEKARKVKINPEDWVNNPDRYLLELAGHPSYSRENNRASVAVERTQSSKSERSRHPS